VPDDRSAPRIRGASGAGCRQETVEHSFHLRSQAEAVPVVAVAGGEDGVVVNPGAVRPRCLRTFRATLRPESPAPDRQAQNRVPFSLVSSL
jgi:hypothetical protein